jgi:hypothetical protein
MVAQPLRKLPTLTILFLGRLPQLYNVEFSGTIVAGTWQISENLAQIATMETKLRFFVFRNNMHDGPICRYMLGIRIPQSACIRIFLFRSGSLKELWQFTVN